ncbi:rhomboid-like protein [Streptomyces sp. BI20]|uniref:rhomboid-like protein n=1 Tax=Streptomyces sp. BI20 TaxID=3403460 RepID=UPI003C752913
MRAAVWGPAYVGGVQAGAWAMARMDPEARRRVLREWSTNVDNLAAGRWLTLGQSALVVEEPMPLPYALLLLAVLGYAEYAYGVWWTAAVFLFGHVGASLLVYGGLRARRVPTAGDPGGDAGARAGTDGDGTGGDGTGGDAVARGRAARVAARREAVIRGAVDVGTSYGFNAVVGALTSALPAGRVRIAARVGLVALAAVPVVSRRRTFTDAGHATAVALGVGVAVVVDCLSPRNHRRIIQKD